MFWVDKIKYEHLAILSNLLFFLQIFEISLLIHHYYFALLNKSYNLNTHVLSFASSIKGTW